LSVYILVLDGLVSVFILFISNLHCYIILIDLRT